MSVTEIWLNKKEERSSASEVLTPLLLALGMEERGQEPSNAGSLQDLGKALS